MSKIHDYYEANEDILANSWAEYLSYAELGSGEDKIKITEEMFWEFIEEKMEEEAC